MSRDELLKHAVETWSPEDGSDAAGGAVRVNGVEISARAINIESANYEQGTIVERQHQAAVALVIRELLRQRAVTLQLLEDGAELDDAVIDRLLDEEVDVPRPDEAACRRYFEQNRSRFRDEDRVRLRHILLPAHPEDLDERERIRHTAENLIEHLRTGSEAFDELAQRHSVCPSRTQGGDLGWIGRNQTVPEFEETVLKLPTGCAGRPVESRYGWHVVEILERRDGQQQPFEAVHFQIADYLAESVRRRALSQYLRVLAGEAEIEGLELEGAESPLIQ
ncbi:MAG TPA: peptidylprolyl isomerase [Arenicellales bacterium]|nr:peptidylprolyl isomerase [Arenicellales bacterium]